MSEANNETTKDWQEIKTEKVSAMLELLKGLNVSQAKCLISIVEKDIESTSIVGSIN